MMSLPGCKALNSYSSFSLVASTAAESVGGGSAARLSRECNTVVIIVRRYSLSLLLVSHRSLYICNGSLRACRMRRRTVVTRKRAPCERLHLLVGLGVAAVEAGARVLVGRRVVLLGPPAVAMRLGAAPEQAGAHVHAQRAQATLLRLVLRALALVFAARALLAQLCLAAPHLARARLDAGAHVKAHVVGGAARVRVAPHQRLERRRPRVQVAVL